MTKPVTNEKPLKKWSYEDLCRWSSWQVALALLRGDELDTVMYGILETALRWKREKGGS